MQTCPNCRRKLSRFGILRSVFLAYQNIHCTSCKAELEHTFLNEIVVALAALLTMIIAYSIGEHFELGSGTFLIAAVLVVLLTAGSSWLFHFKKA